MLSQLNGKFIYIYIRDGENRHIASFDCCRWREPQRESPQTVCGRIKLELLESQANGRKFRLKLPASPCSDKYVKILKANQWTHAPENVPLLLYPMGAANETETVFELVNGSATGSSTFFIL